MLDNTIRWIGGAAVLALVLGALPASAQNPNLYLTPDSGGFSCGGIYALDLMIDDTITDLQGASLELVFDDYILTPLTVSAGALINGASCPHYANWTNEGAGGSTITVDIATLGCSVAGPGSILHLTFEGYHKGTSTVNCASGVLRDSNNQDIPYTCGEASIYYDCVVDDQAQAWGAVKAVYR